jgi:hypothetical protein
MKFSSQTVIDHPADRIDLAQWLSSMSDPRLNTSMLI